MVSDTALRQDIIDEIDFEPSIDGANIGVVVEDGIVTLTGHVSTYSQKVALEDVVRRIKGVKGIAEEVEVRPFGTNITADDEIAKRAVNSLAWNTTVPNDTIQVKVQDGWLTLTGKVDWQYQRIAAENVARALAGVVGVTNQIEIKAMATADDVKKRIEDALRRNAETEARGIKVDVLDGGKVTLAGRVHSWFERSAAQQAAWSAPGVKTVDDRLTVG